MSTIQEQPVLSHPTDTVTPIASVPIFYMHTGAHPFCNQAGCLCMAYNEQLEGLLSQIISTDLKLRKFQRGYIRWEVQ